MATIFILTTISYLMATNGKQLISFYGNKVDIKTKPT